MGAPCVYPPPLVEPVRSHRSGVSSLRWRRTYPPAACESLSPSAGLRGLQLTSTVRCLVAPVVCRPSGKLMGAGAVLGSLEARTRDVTCVTRQRRVRVADAAAALVCAPRGAGASTPSTCRRAPQSHHGRQLRRRVPPRALPHAALRAQHAAAPREHAPAP